ncbi:MAG: acyltransferase [Thermoleophilaceae bacterium]|nr:acyltransferase [Thermoleophilaceae bacterium]
MWLYEKVGMQLEDRGKCVLMMHAEVLSPGGISIGSGTVIGREVVLDGRGGLKIGRNANISSRTQIYTGTHDIHADDFAAEFNETVIEDNVWLGIGATILDGVTIGRGAVVAAGAVVTKDVAALKVVGGIPAREIGERGSDLSYELDYRPNGL